ncbi:hypothetical protein DFH11DRAFT_1736154 [Phellopilus nigrolimitatus]|nr:hypothetical protein DFH11DRAFT_1885302 [Phellopilus nigrolimitatus]KAH8101670.1 hypothetical protein DFH11DRAFT_1736154 [Phellopilus nigrolimitatus]
MLLLVVSETGLLYTFTIAKLQPLVKQLEGKNLIQACLNVPHRPLPSNMPAGNSPNQPQMASMQATGGTRNFPGLSISGTPPGGPGQEDDAGGDHGDNVETEGEKRSSVRCRTSASKNAGGPTSPSPASTTEAGGRLCSVDARAVAFSSYSNEPRCIIGVLWLFVRSFRQSIGNSSNRKKTFSTFTQYNFTR